jgi:hypothetical protein
MIVSWSDIATFASALPLSFVVVQIGQRAYKRMRRTAIVQCVARLSEMIVADEEPSDDEMRLLRRRYPPGVVLDSALFVAEKLYGGALNRLALIVEVCELDYYLLAKIRRAGGVQRVRNLSKLSFLTNAVLAAEYAEVYMEEGRIDTRFHAMAAMVAARPDRAMKYLAKYNLSLSLHEVAMIAHLMRRAGAAVAYTPMLTSRNCNLQMVGIYLVHHFELVDAEPHLQRLLHSEDEEVAYMALQALCAIRGDISTPQVGRVLQQLAPHLRHAFILRAVHNCYSLRSCAHHLSREECAIFSRRINSYKCRIVCN